MHLVILYRIDMLLVECIQLTDKNVFNEIIRKSVTELLFVVFVKHP